jgi:hypothetical protein
MGLENLAVFFFLYMVTVTDGSLRASKSINYYAPPNSESIRKISIS